MKNKLIFILIALLLSCKSQKIEWDFNKEKKIKYSYTQNTTSNFKINNNTTKSKAVAKGFLDVIVKKNRTADLSLQIKMYMLDKKGKIKDSLINTPKLTVRDMKSDGTFKSKNKNILFDLVFPLPAKKIKKGKQFIIPMEMPWKSNGRNLTIKGTNTLKYIGYKKINNIQCILFNGKIDVSDIEIPKKIKGTHQSSLKGYGSYYFDPKNNIYMGADIKIVIENKGGSVKHSSYNINSINEYKIRLVK